MAFKFYKFLLLVLGFSQLGGLALVMMGIVGFDSVINSEFDDDNSSNEHQNNNCSNQEIISADVLNAEGPKKLALIVIDALRTDMIVAENFPFLLGSGNSVKKQTRGEMLRYNVTVDSPTVTLPRVKTLITGRSPTYLDILKNFQTSDNAYATNQIKQDNIISSLHRCKPETNICFFGDETWLRLFPKDDLGKSKYFHKFDGVTSFFVKDFYEVDANVTRHLTDIEDCHFLILHYLGLDHVGHVHGPSERPDLIKKKLIEMDTVIQKLYSTWAYSTGGTSNLIMITGDHGMANVGGHGGSSFEEVTTPLMAIINGFRHLKNTKPKEGRTLNQVDIAPTLALLLGLNSVPKESTGQLILDIIQPFQSSQQLAFSYHKNCEHLLKQLGDSREASTYKLWLVEISKMDKPLSIKKYIELEYQLAETIRNSKNINHGGASFSFIVGFLIITMTEIFLLVYFLNNVSEAWNGKEASLFLAFFPPIILYFSSSFIEEEHYVRYFIFSCLILFLYVSSHPTDLKCFQKVIKILLLHRIVIDFNQTGDKWNQLRDLNDIINGYHCEWVTSFIGAYLVYRFISQSGRSSSSLLLKITLGFIYLSKALDSFSSQLGALLLRIVAEHHLQQIAYGLIVLNGIFTFRHFDKRTASFTIILLIYINLQRVNNLIVTGMTLTLLQEMVELFHHQCILKTEFLKTQRIQLQILTQLAFIWIAHSAFFYQGNSNGLATVDVNAGYTGFGSFSSSILIGILIFLHTYGGPIMIHLHFLTLRLQPPVVVEYSVNQNGVDGKKDSKSNKRPVGCLITNPLPLLMLISNGAEAVVYATSLIIHKNHLFIWSVFMPKLLYLIAQSVMYFVFTFIYFIV